MSLAYQANSDFNIQGFLQRLDNYLNKFENNITEIECDRERKAVELASARQSQGQPFPQADLLNTLCQDNREVMRELQLSRIIQVTNQSGGHKVKQKKGDRQKFLRNL